jgi:hypothetical protein
MIALMFTPLHGPVTNLTGSPCSEGRIASAVKKQEHTTLRNSRKKPKLSATTYER